MSYPLDLHLPLGTGPFLLTSVGYGMTYVRITIQGRTLQPDALSISRVPVSSLYDLSLDWFP